MMQQDLKASSSKEENIADHYMILKTLGTGSFAEVKLACHLHTDVQVAMKILERNEKKASLIANELEIMKLLDHQNIIKLFHVMETTDFIYVIMEHASRGDLAGRIVEVGSLQQEETQHIFTQIVCAINYCHENDIAHRDIKPDNILLDSKGNIKLCDFGLATKVTPGQRLKVFCGTLPYCAPELFSGQGYDPKTPDIWSLGVVLYIMLTGCLPFKATTYKEMKMEMQEPHVHLPPKLPAHIVNLIVQLFIVDCEQRPKIGDIIEHPWINKCKEFSKLSSSLETLHSSLNPSIMAAMWIMGYNPKDIRDSLHEKKYNSIMATYLILKHQSPLGDNAYHEIKPVQPGVAGTLAFLPMGKHPRNRTGSEPTLPTFILLAKHQLCDNKKLARKTDNKSASMPDILCFQQRRSLPPDTAAQCGPVTPQPVSHSLQKRNSASKDVSSGNASLESVLSENHISQVASQSKTTPKSSMSPQNTPPVKNSREVAQDVITHQEDKSFTSIETSESNVTSAQPQTVTTTSLHNVRRGWTRIKKRIVNCFRRLCCCLLVQVKVAPLEEDSGVTRSQ